MKMLNKAIIQLIVLLIKTYQYCISPLLPNTCRFYPSCSEYSLQAVERFGLFKGGPLIIKRLISCQPFSKRSGWDPVDTASFPDYKRDYLSCTCKKGVDSINKL